MNHFGYAMVDLSFFYQHGYQILDGLFPDSLIQKIRGFLTLEINKALQLIQKTIPFSSVEELIGKIGSIYEDPSAFNALDVNLKNVLCGHFSLETRLNELLHLIPKSENVQRLCKQLFPEISARVHLPPTARFVLPQNRFAAVFPHQDVSYNKHLKDFVVLWVPLTVIDDQCGGVIVHHGSGNLSEIPLKQGRKFWLEGIEDLGYQKIHCKMNPGSALLLNKWIVHQSAENNSDRTRISLDLRFFYGSSEKHYLDMDTWKIAAPETCQGSIPK